MRDLVPAIFGLSKPPEIPYGANWLYKGLYRAKEIRRVFGFVLFFLSLLWYLWGLDYSKMAN